MTEWRFYGRADELDHLQRKFTYPVFNANRVEGRRGVGKTELFMEAIRRLDADTHGLLFELRSLSSGNPDETGTRFINEVFQSLPESLLDGFPPLDTRHRPLPLDRFMDILAWLLERGITIVLDEFHLARPLGLEGPLKTLIDGYKSTRPTEHLRFTQPIEGGMPPMGALLVTGSHQQKLRDMFERGQPLYQRLPISFALQPWPMATVLEMADEQGLLAHPLRFLTLWTAFGDIPRHWNDFISEGEWRDIRNMQVWANDTDWRHAFLETQRQRLTPESEDRADNRAYIELRPAQTDILQWIASHSTKGVALNSLKSAMRSRGHQDFDHHLDVLENKLDLLKIHGEYGRESHNPQVQITDNPTLFQRSVYPEIFLTVTKGHRFSKTGTGATDSDRRLRRLETIEGHALERLAAGWLTHQPDITWAEPVVWRRSSDWKSGHVEVDVLAYRADGRNNRHATIMAACKRNPERHAPDSIHAGFDAFHRSVTQEGCSEPWPDGPDIRLCISPSFTESQRRYYNRQGLACLGFADMLAGNVPYPPLERPDSSAVDGLPEP